MSDKPEMFDAQGRRLPVMKCPTCQHPMDAATRMLGQERPRPGDLSVCLKCAEVLVFQPDMSMRLALLNDLIDLPKSEARALDKARALIRRTRPLG